MSKQNARLKSRRRFLSTTAAAAFSFTIVPRHVLGGPGQVPPSERVNVAGIGAGGMGGGDIATVHRLGANIVALCRAPKGRPVLPGWNGRPTPLRRVLLAFFRD